MHIILFNVIPIGRNISIYWVTPVGSGFDQITLMYKQIKKKNTNDHDTSHYVSTSNNFTHLDLIVDHYDFSIQ